MTGPVLVLTVSPWSEPKRLRKQVAEVLSADNEVTYVTLPYGLRKPNAFADDRDGRVRVIALPGPLLPLRLLHRFPVLTRLYQRLLGRRLHRALRATSRPRAVFCFTPDHPELLATFQDVPIIYVANDDHASMAASDHAGDTIRRNEARAIAFSDRVVSVSEVIARKLAVHGKPVHVMYPGHDCTPLPLETFDRTDRVSGSVCFFGYVDWRIDFELLDHLLRHGRHVCLVGPIVGTQRNVDALREQFPQRFELRPAVEPDEAPRLLARYEVLAIPYKYRTREQAEVMELPNKMFIYFAALRPVVTTDMPNLKLVRPGLVYRSSGSDEFLANCVRAVADDGRMHAAERSSIAAQNTWNARRATLEALIAGDAAALAALAT